MRPILTAGRQECNALIIASGDEFERRPLYFKVTFRYTE